MELIYFFIAFIATFVGAVAGLGGGIIIKPALDAIGMHSISTIGVLSSFTVFSMAVVAITKRLKDGIKIQKRLVFLAIGSILGGIIGKLIFSLVIELVDESFIKMMQSLILALLLIIVLFKDKLPKWNFHNFIVTGTIGLILGIIASFLGIGGGPLNVAILCMFLGMDSKEAAVNSIFIILFSQFSKLIAITAQEGLGNYSLNMLLFMIPAGIIGGLLGSFFHDKISHKTTDIIFNISVFMVILLNLYNFFIELI